MIELIIFFLFLGLGDTNYDQFCQSGKTVDAKLVALGGTRAKALGMADEATGLEEVVEPWVETVIDDLRQVVFKETSQSSNVDVREETSAAEVCVEEKKEDLGQCNSVLQASPITDKVKNLSLHSNSVGVNLVHALATALDLSIPLSNVPLSSLPSLGASLSSCQLLDKGHDIHQSNVGSNLADENMTMTSSTSSCQYNMTAPFESTILSARYVTNSSIEPAREACAFLLKSKANVSEALKCFDKGFPLGVKDEINGKRVIQIELSLPDDFSLQYSPGDSIGILVDNDVDAVATVLNMLQTCHGITSDQLVLLNESEHRTVQEVVSRDIDLCSIIKKRTLSALAQHTFNEDEARILQVLASKSEVGEILYQKFVEEQMISVADILVAFPSCNPPIEALVGIIPAIAPRYYSVSSSPLVYSSSLTIAFSVVDFLTSAAPSNVASMFPEYSSRRKRGVATRFMEAVLSPFLVSSNESYEAPKLRIFPKPTQDFVLPANSKVPLILIGPGTGVAPFIGFLAHRQAQKKRDNELKAEASQGTWRGGYELEEGDIPVTSRVDSDFAPGAEFRQKMGVGSIDLFFGCRHSTHDWLFKNEMEEFLKTGTLTCLHTAFSRDDKGKKVYVQHKLVEEGTRERIVNLLTAEDASIYICGDGNAMAKDVTKALEELLQNHSDVSDAKTFLGNLKDRRKFLLDIWS